MSTYLTAFCNTTTDLLAVEPGLESFDQKRPVRGHDAVNSSVYEFHNVGYVGALYRDDIDLGAAESGSVNVDADGKWYYDSSADVLYLYSTGDPDTSHTLFAGQDWATLKTQAVNRASERVRSLVGRPILKRVGTGQQSETLRDYEDIIVCSTAILAVASLVRPYNQERAQRIESEARNPEGTGYLDLLRAGKASLWNEVSPALQDGLVREVSVNAASTGGIVDVAGQASTRWDAIKVIIGTGGTFAQGSASSVTYSVYVGDDTSLKVVQVVTNQVINGGYQPLAHGLWVRFAPGDYNANDEWEVVVSGAELESGSDVSSIPIQRVE